MKNLLLIICLITINTVFAQSEPDKEETFNFIVKMLEQTMEEKESYYKNNMIVLSHNSNKLEVVTKEVLHYTDFSSPDITEISYLNFKKIKSVKVKEFSDGDKPLVTVYFTGRYLTKSDDGQEQFLDYDSFRFKTIEDANRLKKAIEHLKKLLDEEEAKTNNSFFDN